MVTIEPDIVKGKNPEASLQKAIIQEIRRLLNQEDIVYILIEKFGLDIGVFIRKGEKEYSRFIELKTFVGNRNGGVGFGNKKGVGVQVDLLMQSQSDLKTVDSSIMWLIGFGNKSKGSPRFAFFTSVQAKNAAMGMVKYGKQNNLKVRAFQNNLVTWVDLSNALHNFLLNP